MKTGLLRALAPVLALVVIAVLYSTLAGERAPKSPVQWGVGAWEESGIQDRVQRRWEEPQAG
jgi:hypothetical protein